MADIKINDIKSAGAELFADSESFLNSLDDSDLNSVFGGTGNGGCITSALSCNGGCHPQIMEMAFAE